MGASAVNRLAIGLFSFYLVFGDGAAFEDEGGAVFGGQAPEALGRDAVRARSACGSPMLACAGTCILLGGDEFLALVGGDEFPHPVGKAHRLLDAVALDPGDGGAHVSFAVDVEDAFLPDECLGGA